MKAGAPFNNQNAVKLKTKAIRQKAYKAYCQHLADGWPIECFTFEDGDLKIAYGCILDTIKRHPEEFAEVEIRFAQAKRFRFWLEEGKKLMTGKYQYGSPVIWQTMMRNMFKEHGWDQKEFFQEQGPTEASKLTLAKMKEVDVGNYHESQATPKFPGSNFEN